MKQLENQWKRERERKKQLFRQWTNDRERWRSLEKKETDKGRPRDLGPGDSVQVTAQGPKQPRRLHELK